MVSLTNVTKYLNSNAALSTQPLPENRKGKEYFQFILNETSNALNPKLHKNSTKKKIDLYSI